MNYEEFIEQAERHYKAHEYPQAVVCATQAIDSDKTRVEGYFWRGSVYRMINANEDMLKDADELLNCAPNTALNFAYRGWAYIVKKDYKNAINECSKTITHPPSVKEAYYYRAWAYDDLEEYDLAINDCNEAIIIDNKFASAYNLCGNIYYHRANIDQAITYFDKAIEFDPKNETYRNNRLKAYHAKDENIALKLVDIRKNKQYIKELQENIDNVIPFLGAGASKPYGYYTWEELLRKLLDVCCNRYNVNDEKKEEIQEYINDGFYIDAASEMDKIFSNINLTISTIIGRVAEANPIKIVNMRSILSEYLHLFPNKLCLTTNYDTVAQEIFIIQGKSVRPVYPRNLPIKESKKLDLTRYQIRPSDEEYDKTIYYLHGLYNIPVSITLSKLQYDDYYGADDDIRSNLRRSLPSELYSIYHNSIFLYIGCGMIIKEDRILKVLREFCRSLPNSEPSYALLNINEVAETDEPYENWKTLSDEIRLKLNKILDEKEDELADMNVRIIWYSAPKDFVDGHESAKRQLFKNILDRIRRRIKEDKLNTEKENVENARKLQEMFDIMPSDTQKNVEEISLSEVELQQIGKLFQGEIFIEKDIPTRYAIKFPMYKTGDELYQIYLLSENGKYYLSDEGATYMELDKVFELAEPDVIKNLVAILKQYGCYKRQNSNAFVIDCKLEDIHIKMSHLIQAISFMLNMKIFYV